MPIGMDLPLEATQPDGETHALDHLGHGLPAGRSQDTRL